MKRGKSSERSRQPVFLCLCLNSTSVCQQSNHRIYRGTESLISIPVCLKSDGFSAKAALDSFSHMAQCAAFVLDSS